MSAGSLQLMIALWLLWENIDLRSLCCGVTGYRKRLVISLIFGANFSIFCVVMSDPFSSHTLLSFTIIF